jgi:hypothetical protein
MYKGTVCHADAMFSKMTIFAQTTRALYNFEQGVGLITQIFE